MPRHKKMHKRKSELRDSSQSVPGPDAADYTKYLKQRCEDYAEQVASKDKEVSVMRKLISALQSDLKKLQIRVEESSDLCKEMSKMAIRIEARHTGKSLSDLGEENSFDLVAKTEQWCSLDSVERVCVNSLNSLREANEFYVGEIDTIRFKHEAMQRSDAVNRNKLANTENALNRVKVELRALKEDYTNAFTDKLASDAANKALKNQNNRLQDRNKQLELELVNLQQPVVNDTQQEEMRRLQDENNHVVGKNGYLTSQNWRLVRQIAITRARAKSLHTKQRAFHFLLHFSRRKRTQLERQVVLTTALEAEALCAKRTSCARLINVVLSVQSSALFVKLVKVAALLRWKLSFLKESVVDADEQALSFLKLNQALCRGNERMQRCFKKILQQLENEQSCLRKNTQQIALRDHKNVVIRA